MKRTVLFLLPGVLLSLAACNDEENEDLTQNVNRNGSVESSIQVQPIDSFRHELVTSHKVWVRDSIYRTLVYRDTLPGLGLEQTVAENEEGDQQSVTVNKNYEIYITVK